MAKRRAQTAKIAAAAAAGFEIGKHKASNKNLKRAAHQGRTAVSDTRKAPPGYVIVPASVATLPPGLGPPMSSIPGSAGRGRKSTKRSSKSQPKIVNRTAGAYGGTSIWSPHSVKIMKRKKRR